MPWVAKGIYVYDIGDGTEPEPIYEPIAVCFGRPEVATEITDRHNEDEAGG